jgi:catechol 2,3-dioxygenase-like lactoylglutathione lyase family enzyme
MEVISRTPRSLYLDAGAFRLELIHKDVYKDDERLTKLGVHHLSFKVENIQEETEKLKAKGVSFIKEPYLRAPGLQLAFFDGLDNVVLQLMDDKR